MIIPQIETAQGLGNVDKIAAVEGVDALLIGPYDLSTSLGIPGQFENARFRDATRQVLEACERHGKVAVLATMDVGGFRRPVEWIQDADVPRRCVDLPTGSQALLPLDPRVPQCQWPHGFINLMVMITPRN